MNTVHSGHMWERGDVIPVRHVWRGRVWYAHSAIVVHDRPSCLLLYEPVGAVRQWSYFHFRTGHITPPAPRTRHTHDGLTFIASGAAHAISLFWNNGRFVSWYVDLQESIRRGGGGVVTWDQTLDIVVEPNYSWRWKDEDQLARSVHFGWMTPAQAAEIKREGERVVDKIEHRRPPFDGSWNDWRPATWTIPALPDDWALVPAAS